MEKDNECDIVKDLSSQYVEDIVSSNTKTFIENHIENCNNCKKYYEAMKLNILEETKLENQKEYYELDFLKKIRNRITILKSIVYIFIILILLVVGIFLIKYQKINNIINNSYNEIQNMKEISNYKLTTNENYINFKENTSFNVKTEYYYKNGKYKIDSGNAISYYEDNSYNKICIYNDLKQIEYYTQDIVEKQKGSTFNIFTEIITYKKELNGILKLALSIKNDRYNGIDCYVIRFGNNNIYRDVWINKNDFKVLRVVEEEYLSYFRETTYTLEIDKTIDQDVDTSILDTNTYKDYKKITFSRNATEEQKQYYEFINQ